jgi:RimJ/RimL family protein N-acetyltransferase
VRSIQPTASEPVGRGLPVGLELSCDGDAEVAAAWGRDAVIVRWTGVPANQTEEAALAWVVRVEEGRRAGRMLALAIADAESGVVLGSCDIRRPDPDDWALGEVGYVLSERARGRGVATRAMRLLIDWSFRELGMERVRALVHPDNPPSAAVLDRLGFKRECLLQPYRAGDDGREDRVSLRGPARRAGRARRRH